MENIPEEERSIEEQPRRRSRSREWLQSIKKATKEVKKGICAVVTICQADQSVTEPAVQKYGRSGPFEINSSVEDQKKEGFDGRPQVYHKKKEDGSSPGNKQDGISGPHWNKKKHADALEMDATIQAAGEKNASILLEIINFIREIEKIVHSTQSIKDAVYTPFVILLHIKKHYSEVKTMELKWIEDMINTEIPERIVESPAEDLHNEVIEYFIAEGMEPTMCISYWISCCKPLEKAYASLYNAVLASAQNKHKDGSKTERSMIFYNTVLKSVREKVSNDLANLEEPENPQFEDSELFTEIVEKTMLYERVQGYINIDSSLLKKETEFERLYREFLAENLECDIDSEGRYNEHALPARSIPIQATSQRIRRPTSNSPTTGLEVRSASSRAKEELLKFRADDESEAPSVKEKRPITGTNIAEDKEKVTKAHTTIGQNKKKEKRKPAETIMKADVSRVKERGMKKK